MSVRDVFGFVSLGEAPLPKLFHHVLNLQIFLPLTPICDSEFHNFIIGRIEKYFPLL